MEKIKLLKFQFFLLFFYNVRGESVNLKTSNGKYICVA